MVVNNYVSFILFPLYLITVLASNGLMKKLLVLSALALSVSFIYGQALPADNLLSTLNLQAAKFDTWLARKKFFFANSTKLNDTLVKVYNFKSEIKKKKLVDSIKRCLIRKDGKEGYTITYQTVSQQEIDNLKKID